MSECQRCERPVQDARICTLCGRDLERALGNVPMLEAELNLTITRQRRFTPQSDGSRGSETPVVFHVKASEAYWTLRNILVSWAKFYAEECGADLPADTLAALSRFLLKRAEWLRHHELALDAVNEITDAVRHAARLIDAPANRTTFGVGPCPEVDTSGTHCCGEVRAYIPTSNDMPAWMGCDTCRKEWATWEWLRAGRRIMDRHTQVVTARLTVVVVGV